MPTQIATDYSSRERNNRYKRADRDDEGFDRSGKKQSDYRRMQSYKELQKYFDNYNK